MSLDHLFRSVVERTRSIRTLETVLDVLTWDQETMMPPEGNGHRSEQKALLSGIIHNMKCDPQYFEDVERLTEVVGPDQDEAVIAQKLHRDISKARKLPTEFVQHFSRTTSEAFGAWQAAKTGDRWDLFEPHLEGIVRLLRQKCEYLGYTDHPLDALLDEHEPEAKTSEIAALFLSLKTKLQTVLQEVQGSPLYGRRRRAVSASQDQQFHICRQLVSFVGFDWNRGRLDTSEHPFSTAFHPTDSRITIRRQCPDLLDQLMSALHEAGHSFYETGLDPMYFGTPLGETASLSIHESQSRLWETLIGRSRWFSPTLLGMMSQVLPKQSFQGPDELYQELNRVLCSCVRTEADEVTYPFHVIMRFDIEKDLIDGSLLVRDLKDRWNADLYRLLGVSPASDREGCLQDVHWSLGSFGYFPTYTLGSLYAVCWYKAMKQALPDLEQQLARGEVAPIHSWLRDHVWRHGRRFSSVELVSRALGRRPTEDDYVSYIRDKYTAP